MAAETDPVMAMVEREVEKNPEVTNEELYEKAVKIDPEIAKLDRRQFNARYTLQVKRRLRPAGRRRRAAAPAAARPRRRARAAAGRPVRRVRAPRVAGAPRAARARAPGREDAVRRLLIQFARDAIRAERAGDPIAPIAAVDRYVSQLLRAARA